MAQHCARLPSATPLSRWKAQSGADGPWHAAGKRLGLPLDLAEAGRPWPGHHPTKGAP